MSQSTAALSTKPKHLSWAKLAAEQLSPLLSRRYVSGEKSTVARFELKKGCVVPRHEHENEQTCTVVSGALKFIMDDAEYLIRAGELLVIPPHVPHAAEAVEDSVVFDFFSPARADWAKQQDQYLRASK
jgi:quercetin dioxygenase-like cupin family protein